MKNIHFIKTISVGLVSLLLLISVGCSKSSDSGLETVQTTREQGAAAVQTPAQTINHQSVLESNKEVVRRYVESLGSGDALILLSPNHHRFRHQFQNLVVNADGSNLVEIADPLDVAIPDRVEVIEEIVAEDDIVGVQTRITGTHLGNLYGIPATGASIDIVASAFYRLAEGKIIESWEMADEAGLLRQIAQWLPARADAQRIAPTVNYPVRLGSEVLAEIMANPADTDTHTNKVRVSAYKSEIRPPDQIFEGRPYEVYARSGFYHIGTIGRATGMGEFGMGHAFPDRLDKVGLLIAEDDKVMIQFLLTATNTGSLFGNPPSNESVGAWEVGVHSFEGTTWKTGWWFGDDLGMMLQIGVPGEFLLADIPEQASAP